MRILGPLAGLCLFALAQHSAAQTATPLDRYHPSPSGDDLLGVPEPHVRGHLRPIAGVHLNVARSPLVIVDGGEEMGAVVDHQLILHNLLALELWQRLKLEVDVPIVLSQGGDNPPIDGGFATSPSGAAMGDVRVGARVQLLRQDGLWPGAAVAMTTWFPSGDSGAYASSGYVRYAPSLVIGASDDILVYSATVGRRFDPADATLLGDELFFGAGVGPRIGDLLISAELVGATDVGPRQRPFRHGTTHLEAHLGLRYDLGPVRFQAMGGPGLTTAPGTPDWRLGLFIGYVPPADPVDASDEPPERYAVAPPDASAVGVADTNDTAGTGAGSGSGAGTGTSAAADPALTDSDGDGLVDADDRCPRRVGPIDGVRPGCPPDEDGDGFVDSLDACPSEPGVASVVEGRNGCPGDRDGDGIDDPRDACPDEQGEATDDPKTSGCPKSVRVVGEQIVILQKVEFATGAASLAGNSAELLAEVARVLADHPEIVRVAIEGHTDNTGSESENIKLSQQRALTVMRWLIDNGVDERRLEARGYGPRRPIADNGESDGRAKNRRVDFQILKRDPRRQEAWSDGAIEAEPSAPEGGE